MGYIFKVISKMIFLCKSAKLIVNWHIIKAGQKNAENVKRKDYVGKLRGRGKC